MIHTLPVSSVTCVWSIASAVLFCLRATPHYKIKFITKWLKSKWSVIWKARINVIFTSHLCLVYVIFHQENTCFSSLLYLPCQHINEKNECLIMFSLYFCCAYIRAFLMIVLSFYGQFVCNKKLPASTPPPALYHRHCLLHGMLLHFSSL